MITAIILDDELSGRKNLENLVAEYCPHISIAGSFEDSSAARQFLDNHNVQAIFLDIMMPGENGFEFLQSLKKPYAVVFVTAYDGYAIRAIRASAVDYLLKPVHTSDLAATEQRLLHTIGRLSAHSGDVVEMLTPLKTFLENYNETQKIRKITLHHQKGFNIVDTEKIVRLEADGNYTTFYICDGEKIVTSRPIGDFEQILDTPGFIRVHRSHIINLDHMEQYCYEDTGYVILSGGHRVEVSRRRFPLLSGRLASYTKETRS
jgi:two-component system LytT family response regulator